MFRRRWAGSLIGLSLVISACTTASTASPSQGESAASVRPSEAASEAPSAEPTEALEPFALNLGVHWTWDVADWAGIILAQENGYFEDEALDVTITYLQGSNAVVPAVGAGTVDIGLAGPDSILAGAAQGLPLTAVANHLQNSTAGVVVPADSAIEEFADLAGLRISTAAASPEQALLRVVLNEAGVDPDADVELIYVDPQTKCTIAIAGETDACTGQSNFHPQQFEGAGVAARFLSFTSAERPILGATTFTSHDFLAEHPDVVERFLRAAYRGWADFAASDTDELVDIYVERRGEVEEYLGDTLDVTRDTLIFSERTDEEGWGWMTDEAWTTLHDALLEAEVLTAEVDVSELYTNDYLPAERDFPRP